MIASDALARLTEARTLWDVTVPIRDGMIHWPGDPEIRVTVVSDVAQGDVATVTSLNLGSHTGTHVDAFSHFCPGRETLDGMRLDLYTGRAKVVDIDDPVSIRPEALTSLDWERVERVLFRTRNSTGTPQPWYERPFNEDFVHLTPEAADFLVERGVRLVGIDYLSVDGFRADNVPVHRRLMAAGVHIVEGLYLAEVPAGWVELLCLPMRIAGCDGAPARVLLREWRD